MAFCESSELDRDRVAKANMHRANQKMLDRTSYHIKVFEYLKIKRKKELEFGKDWVFKEELSKRIKQDRRLEADDAAIGKKSKMSIDEMVEELKLSMARHAAARREGKVVDEDISMFRDDIDVYAGALVPKGTDDAYRSVSDKVMNTDFFKTDESSIGISDQAGPGDDDPAEFHMEPQGTPDITM